MHSLFLSTYLSVSIYTNLYLSLLKTLFARLAILTDFSFKYTRSKERKVRKRKKLYIAVIYILFTTTQHKERVKELNIE